MISLFRKRAETNIILELTKSYIIDSVVDDFRNELLFPGNISVSINGLDEGLVASWTLTNVQTQIELGSFTGNQTVERLDVGEYEIKFNPVTKYITPENQKKIVSERQTVIVVGNYIRNLGDFNIRIDSNLKNFNVNLSNWSITGLNLDYFKQGSGEELVKDLSLGNYKIMFDPIEGFQSPEEIISTIEPNKTKDILGLYTIECSSTGSTGNGNNIIIYPRNNTLPQANRNEYYEVQLSATGGIAPYTWSVVNSFLPLGLSINSNGLISGTPLEQTIPIGSYDNFTVKVSDSTNQIKTKEYRIRIIIGA